MMKSRLQISIVGLISVVALGAGLWSLIKHRRVTAEAARYQRLTTCQFADCHEGVECALRCARQFLDRNGYGAPALAIRDELVFDVVEAMHGGSLDSILAARANSLNRGPTQVCELPTGGYSLFFSDSPTMNKDGDLLSGRVLLMDKNPGNIHLLHEEVLVTRGSKSLTGSCTFLE